MTPDLFAAYEGGFREDSEYTDGENDDADDEGRDGQYDDEAGGITLIFAPGAVPPRNSEDPDSLYDATPFALAQTLTDLMTGTSMMRMLGVMASTMARMITAS